MKPIKLCVSVVCVDFPKKKCVLVFENQDGKEVVNVPSGHVEDGESPLSAAIRELKEETGIEASQLYFAGTTLLRKDDYDYFTMVYTCEASADTIVKPTDPDDDVQSAEWVNDERLVLLRRSYRNGLVDSKVALAFRTLDAIHSKRYYRYTAPHIVSY